MLLAYLSILLLALLAFVVYTKQHVQPWNKSPLLCIVLFGTMLVFILKKKHIDPFDNDSVDKQKDQLVQIKGEMKYKLDLTRLTPAALNTLEDSINTNTTNISRLQATTGVAREAQKFA
jgi:hypothetical protein